MSVDRYTKAVLTVIAVALAVIAFREAVPQASAFGEGCGSPSLPCFIDTGIGVVLPVRPQ